MVWHGVLAKAAPTVVTGMVGVVAYRGCAKWWRRSRFEQQPFPLRRGVCALRARPRRAEEGTERARLAVADVVAEAAERVGKESTAGGSLRRRPARRLPARCPKVAQG